MRSRYRIAVALLFFAACSNNATVQNNASQQGGGAAASSPSAPGSRTPTSKPTLPDEAADTADFEGTAGVTEKKNPNIKAPAIMSDVRSARHANYDRVVFEFLGDEMPTYHLEYIDKPVRSCGSGEVIQLAGDGYLEVRFTDAQAHAPEGDATIKDRNRSPGLPIVKDLKISCDFEGEVTWVMGIAKPNKYRVLELSKPTRLVVDIKH